MATLSTAFETAAVLRRAKVESISGTVMANQLEQYSIPYLIQLLNALFNFNSSF